MKSGSLIYLSLCSLEQRAGHLAATKRCFYNCALKENPLFFINSLNSRIEYNEASTAAQLAIAVSAAHQAAVHQAVTQAKAQEAQQQHMAMMGRAAAAAAAAAAFPVRVSGPPLAVMAGAPVMAGPAMGMLRGPPLIGGPLMRPPPIGMPPGMLGMPPGMVYGAPMFPAGPHVIMQPRFR